MDNNITQGSIQALKEGDHAAFERIFLFYFNKVKYFIDGFIKSAPDAEALAREVFVELWTNRQDIDPGRNFNTHIYIIARNVTVGFLKRKYMHVLSGGGETDAGENPVCGENLIVAQEIDLLMEMALLKMPGQRRAVYELIHKEGFSVDETAERLGISTKVVENHMEAAAKELKSIINSFILLMS